MTFLVTGILLQELTKINVEQKPVAIRCPLEHLTFMGRRLEATNSQLPTTFLLQYALIVHKYENVELRGSCI